tara:strand:+ start:104 stop:562 length:459 start_codon:yes stop_codon:yes gene_type:complete
MAHFAELDENNIVLRVITFSNDEVNANGGELSVEAENFVAERHGGTWKQTSYNDNFRKQYAGIGWTYDVSKDIFIRPQPFSSWTLDDNNDWKAPVEEPNTKVIDADNNIYFYKWKESSQEWIGISTTRYFTWDSNILQWNENGLEEDWIDGE